jgi:outer membrane immunogenic protein
MKKLLLSTVALAALSASAVAADLPSRRAPPPIAYTAVPVFTWTGFYIGGNAGYAFSTQRNVLTSGQTAVNNATVADGARPGSVQLDQDGFTGGGQIGYNYQMGSFVLGVEADAAYTDLRRTVNAVTTGTAFPGVRNNVFRQDLAFLGTVRGRLGYAFDRVMVYGTGGFAYGDVDYRADFSGPLPAGVAQFTGRRTNMETGWAAGGGVEYALPTSFSLFGSNAVTFKAEALYYDLGRRTVAANVIAGSGGAGTGYNSSFETSGVIARAGLNFKFGTF